MKIQVKRKVFRFTLTGKDFTYGFEVVARNQKQARKKRPTKSRPDRANPGLSGLVSTPSGVV